MSAGVTTSILFVFQTHGALLVFILRGLPDAPLDALRNGCPGDGAATALARENGGPHQLWEIHFSPLLVQLFGEIHA